MQCLHFVPARCTYLGGGKGGGGLGLGGGEGGGGLGLGGGEGGGGLGLHAKGQHTAGHEQAAWHVCMCVEHGTTWLFACTAGRHSTAH